MGLTGLTCDVSTWGGGPLSAVAPLMAAPTAGRLASLVCGFPKSTLNGEPYWSFQRPLLGHKWFIASENVYKIIAVSTKGQIQDDLAATWAFFFPPWEEAACAPRVRTGDAEHPRSGAAS